MRRDFVREGCSVLEPGHGRRERVGEQGLGQWESEPPGCQRSLRTDWLDVLVRQTHSRATTWALGKMLEPPSSLMKERAKWLSRVSRHLQSLWFHWSPKNENVFLMLNATYLELRVSHSIVLKWSQNWSKTVVIESLSTYSFYKSNWEQNHDWRTLYKFLEAETKWATFLSIMH